MAIEWSDWIAMVEYQRAQKEREENAGLKAQEDALREKQLAEQKRKIAEFESILTRGVDDPRALPMYSSLFAQGKEGIEDQFGTARESVLAGPRGGRQLDALSRLESERAGAAGSLPAMISSNLVGDIMNKAYGTAFGASPTALPQPGLGPIDNFFGGVASNEIQEIGNKARENQLYYGGLGGLASSMLMNWGKPNQPQPWGTNATSTNPNWNMFSPNFQPAYAINW